MLLYICTKIFREGVRKFNHQILRSRLAQGCVLKRKVVGSCHPKAALRKQSVTMTGKIGALSSVRSCTTSSCSTSGLCRTAVVSICFYKPSACRRLTMWMVLRGCVQCTSANSVQGKNGKETRGQKKKKKTATGERGHTNTNTVPMTVPCRTVRVAWCRTQTTVGWNDEDTARSWNEVPPDYILA